MKMTNQELWQTMLAQIQLNISQANFATWFKDTQVISQKDAKIINIFLKFYII